MPDQSYFDAAGWSRSELVDFHESRTLFRDRYVTKTNPRKESKASFFEVGEQFHLMLQEPEAFAARCQIIPPDVLTSNGHRRGKAWNYWLEDQPDDVLAMTQSRWDQLREMMDNMLKYDVMRNVLGHDQTIVEQPLWWSYTARNGMTLDLKCEPDLLSPAAETMVDVKTSKEEGVAFRWSVEERKYWLQDAHYCMGVEECHGYRPKFVFAVASTRPRYQADLWEMTPAKRDRAAMLHIELLNDLALCLETGDWTDPDPQPEIKTLHVNF